MPSNATAKIKSALKRLPFRIALALFVALAVAISLLPITSNSSSSRAVLVTLNSTYNLEKATNSSQLEKGLGGKYSLPRNEGMLFVFDKEKEQCFWMKDMHFSLDIIWVNSQKSVVHIEHNVSPKTYPDVFCHEPTRYVVELNAGEAAKANIRQGQVLNF